MASTGWEHLFPHYGKKWMKLEFFNDPDFEQFLWGLVAGT
jgi:hypothetical protein